MGGARRHLRNIAFDAGWDAHEAFAKPEVAEAMRRAYEAGWTDACNDHMEQQINPKHPIGTRKRSNYPEAAS